VVPKGWRLLVLEKGWRALQGIKTINFDSQGPGENRQEAGCGNTEEKRERATPAVTWQGRRR
jgi:hypothetical protein